MLAASALLLAAAVTVFEDVTVVPMDGERFVLHQSVVVRDGVIAEIGPAARVKAPAGAQRIDGRGKFLMPGLAEMHGHLPGPQAEPDLVEDILFLFVANGVTTVRGMYGFPHHVALRDRVAKGEQLGPTLYVASTPISGQTAKTPEDARRLVGEHKAAGFDLLKVHEGLSREAYDAMADAARAAGLAFAGHVPNDVGLSRALEAKQATIEHLDGFLEALETGKDQYDEARIPALARQVREAGARVTPTQALWQTFYGTDTVESLAQRDELKYVPRAMREQWTATRRDQLKGGGPGAAGARVVALRDKVLKALADEKVEIVLGSDAPQLYSVPGFSLHREMDAMVRAGLTPYQVLAAGTRNIALALGAKHRAGTIRTGRQADLILLDENPLVSVANVAKRSGVMVRGRWIPESEIRSRLAEIAARRS